MIAAAARLLGRLRTGRADWKESCRAGPPLPERHRCAALDCDSVALHELREGERATVSCLQEPESRAAAKLVAIGLLPGADVALIQRYPAFVLRLGHAEFALDEEIAGHVRVFRTVPPG